MQQAETKTKTKEQYVLLTVEGGSGTLFLFTKETWDWHEARSSLRPAISYRVVAQSDDPAYLKNLQRMTNERLTNEGD